MARPGPPDLAAIAARFANADVARSAQRGYLRFFESAGTVLDVGCGAGGFLDLLREHGIAGRGIDASLARVERARGRGFDVVHGDALLELERLAGDGVTFDGVFLSHLIEHFDGAGGTALLAACAGVLADGGRLVVVTPNPRHALVGSELFWLDPTHVRPFPRALLEVIGRELGLVVVASFDDPRTRLPRWWLAQLVAGLRSRVSGVDRSGALDAVVVFERPPR